jgi:hypothetical protein
VADFSSVPVSNPTSEKPTQGPCHHEIEMPKDTPKKTIKDKLLSGLPFIL